MKQNVTIQDLLNLMYENEKKAEQRNKEADERSKEADKRMKEINIAADKRMKEADKRMKEADKRMKEINKNVKEMVAVYKKAGLIQGKVAEETIYRSIAPIFEKQGKEFTKVEKNIVVKKEGEKYAEYDILAINGNEVMPVEVKNNLTTTDIDYFLDVQIPKFRVSFPEYKDYKLIAGIGGLVVSKSSEEYAKKKGLYVFLQNGENVSLANTVNFKPKFF